MVWYCLLLLLTPQLDPWTSQIQGHRRKGKNVEGDRAGLGSMFWIHVPIGKAQTFLSVGIFPMTSTWGSCRKAFSFSLLLLSFSPLPSRYSGLKRLFWKDTRHLGVTCFLWEANATCTMSLSVWHKLCHFEQTPFYRQCEVALCWLSGEFSCPDLPVSSCTHGSCIVCGCLSDRDHIALEVPENVI